MHLDRRLELRHLPLSFVALGLWCSLKVENRSNPSYFLPIYESVHYDSKAHRGLYKAAWFSSPWKAIYPTKCVSLFLVKASISIMAEVGDENELLDYEEEETETPAEAQVTKDLAKKDVKGTYVSIHSSGFRDFLLKPELLRAIVDCGFEHPSEGKRGDLAYSIFRKNQNPFFA